MILIKREAFISRLKNSTGINEIKFCVTDIETVYNRFIATN